MHGFCLLRKYPYSFQRRLHCLFVDIYILHRMKLTHCDNATWLIDQIILFLLNDVIFYIMKSNVP